MHKDFTNRFDLSGRVAIVTGGAGFLGRRHAETIVELGGTAILLDVAGSEEAASRLRKDYEGCTAIGIDCDVREPSAVSVVRDRLNAELGRIDILINNAANNPKMENGQKNGWSRLETFELDAWEADISVGLTGAYLCTQTFGSEMADAGKGVILNISSDLGLVGPDQRIYREKGETFADQAMKPVTYSVVKSGLIGLTRYVATYWADRGVRANAIAPGGVSAGQDSAFVERLSNLIPMGRMAEPDEYKAAIGFLISDASSYMTGAVIAIDGGRTAW